MDLILQTGITFIAAIQSVPALTVPMRFFSFLGTEGFFLLVLPIIYWCIDAHAGRRIAVLLLLSGGINAMLKLAWHGPRPYWYSTSIQALSAETSFGAPSGHAQTATVVWGSLASQVRRAWAWPAAVALIALIGFSRLYLGVHFPHDVILGWAVGGMLLWAYLRHGEGTAVWFKHQSFRRQLALSLGSSLIVLCGGLLAFTALRGSALPQAWLDNASAAGVAALPDPITLNAALASSGALFGLLAGLAWTSQRGGFHAGGTTRDKALRYLVGLMGIGIFWVALGRVFPREEALWSHALHYVRYALVGAWIAGGAPYVFFRLGLAAKQGATPPSPGAHHRHLR